MTRPLRIEYPGAWYHVMNRGSTRQAVFKTDAQRHYFLSLLADTHNRFQAEWHVYCLMDNHYHLLVRTVDGNLQRIMRHVNGLYTQYFNRSERRDGPLFRGRYKAVLVDAESHWLELSRYIHRNPLEARICRHLDEYPWSSYLAYVGKVSRPEWLTTGYVLDAIGKRNRQARYAAFVDQDTDEALTTYYEKSKLAPILGDEAFRAKVMSQVQAHPEVPESRAATHVGLKEVMSAVADYYGVAPSTLQVSKRGRGVTNPARSMAMYLCQEVGGLRLSEIAAAFNLRGASGAGSTIRHVRRQLEVKKRLVRDLNCILQDLTP